MFDAVRWLLVLEILGLAFLPLSSWLLGSLPDRGYGAAKIAGLLAVTYVAWLIGSFVPVASSALLPLVVLIAGAAIGWWAAFDRTVASFRPILRVVAVEETIFLAAFIGWCLLRAFVIHPGIAHTEQPMDMALLNGSIHASSYPAYDPWMSGHSINYYYLGYLLYGMVAKLSGVQATVAYNLALSTIPALLASATYGVLYALLRRLTWSLLAPVFVTLLGNWHGALAQIPNGVTPGNTGGWFFDSTRVIGGSNNITEFPFFSFLLGDLHPHVMALPLTLLAATIGCAFLFGTERVVLDRRPTSLARLTCAAIAVGVLFAANSWDYPIYFLLVASGIAVNAYLADDSREWWKPAAIAIVALGVASIALFAPFYANYRSVTHGLGLVSTPSDVWEFTQVLGFFVILAAIVVVALGTLLQPAEEFEGEVDVPSSSAAASEAGQIQAWAASNLWSLLIFAGIAILGIRFHQVVLLSLLAIGGGAVSVLYRVLNTEEPNRADAAALVLVAAGCLAAAIPEVVYLKDVFDGGSNYRMNTVFKFDYQAWVLLGMAGAYAVFRAWQVLRSHFSQVLGVAVLAVAVVGGALGAVYTWAAPQSLYAAGSATSLDVLASTRSTSPGDYAMVRWLDVHASPNATEVEAIGRGTTYDEYNAQFGRIAYLSGLAAVMGWEGHETQWRGPDPEIGARVADVTSIYTTTDIATAKRLLGKYGVRYVIVGDTERLVYGDNPAALAKFHRFMRVAFTVSYTEQGQKKTDTVYTL